MRNAEDEGQERHVLAESGKPERGHHDRDDAEGGNLRGWIDDAVRVDDDPAGGDDEEQANRQHQSVESVEGSEPGERIERGAHAVVRAAHRGERDDEVGGDERDEPHESEVAQAEPIFSAFGPDEEHDDETTEDGTDREVVHDA